MKIPFAFILLLAVGCSSSQQTMGENQQSVITPNDPERFAASITEPELSEHLYIYASDAFEGRETGQPGQKKAVEYIIDQYKALGIPAVKSDGDYKQTVPLETNGVPEGSITINGNRLIVGSEVLTFTEAKGIYNEVVYVGYGIEDENYSDYDGIDVSGKILLAKSGEPRNADGTYRVSGTTEKSDWSNMSESMGKRTALAIEKGAKGVLYFDPQNYARYNRFFNFMKGNKSGRMGLKADKTDAFVILLNNQAVTTLLPDILDNSAARVIPAQVKLDVSSAGNTIDSENIAAILKGTSKPDEYVVISSHLDHIGMTEDGRINNGADDDGSGTVALFEIAEAFKKAKDDGKGPARSIVFLHVTGEEKGLLGSRYYTDFEPLVPLEQTVANLNIDMIGRIDPKRTGDRNYIYLIGSDKLSTELHELSEAVNTKYTQIELDYTYNDENDPNRFYYRSDHYNFAKNNIPIIFYFNGTHADYHRPTDTPDKINYDLLKNRTQLIFHTAWEVANRETKVAVDKAIE
ncbi:M28 family peptidase [Flagellimonas sp. DF-77]|uniref:M28 family peptidase n=1 Tax=Flagellimonas algarum TaxID=3230298 RepID=UPI00339331E3